MVIKTPRCHTNCKLLNGHMLHHACCNNARCCADYNQWLSGLNVIQKRMAAAGWRFRAASSIAAWHRATMSESQVMFDSPIPAAWQICRVDAQINRLYCSIAVINIATSIPQARAHCRSQLWLSESWCHQKVCDSHQHLATTHQRNQWASRSDRTCYLNHSCSMRRLVTWV